MAEVYWKLRVASSAVLIDLHSALAKEMEALKFRVDVKDADKRLEVTHVAESKARDKAKQAKEEASPFEVEAVAKVGRRRDGVGELIKP